MSLLWGKNARFSWLFIAAILMLFTCLGAREIWTQEHRWADIVAGMFYTHDYLHPSLNGTEYYDKPLLSYWLIAGVAEITGKLSTWALRLPSALAGLLAVWSIYRLGMSLKDKSLGLLAGWMLLTTYYFIFWARTSSADMLNMAGTLFAVCWYAEKKLHTQFFDCVVFFLILAVTALCKGLVGPVTACLVILPDLFLQKTWKKHLRLSVILAMVPAAIVYVLPFWASSHFGGTSHYQENGLYLVYRENILRYFQPFDHKGPIYTYFVFLPVYLLPWTLFFIPALFGLRARWKNLSANAKWMVWSVVLLFAFLTLSGSRRNYYVLPLVPFALLMTADWILSGAETLKRNALAKLTAMIFFVVFFVAFDVAQPFYYAQGGETRFAVDVQQAVQKIKPWAQWNVVLLDPESKARFYLELAPDTKNYAVIGEKRSVQTTESLLKAWPFLRNPDAHTIYISRKMYEPMLQSVLKNYDVVEGVPGLGERLVGVKDLNLPVAFIPKK